MNLFILSDTVDVYKRQEEGFVLENPYYLIVTNPFGNNAKITLNPEQLSSCLLYTSYQH